MTAPRLVVLVCLLAAAMTVAAQESTVVVPVVGTAFGQGGVLWKTDLEVYNDTGSPANVALELSTAEDAPAFFFDLAPGEYQRFPDLIQLFSRDFALSPLRVISNTRRALTVRAKVYAVGQNGISQPQLLGVYIANAYSPLRALDDLAFSENYRTNIGLVNFSEREAQFVLALQRLPGRNLAITTITVPPRQLTHLSIQSLFPLITHGDHFTVVVETSNRDTYLYASVLDNDHTGRFVMPRVATR
jgi:hypothetical protein